MSKAPASKYRLVSSVIVCLRRELLSDCCLFVPVRLHDSIQEENFHYLVFDL